MEIGTRFAISPLYAGTVPLGARSLALLAKGVEEMSKIIYDSWWENSQKIPFFSRLVEVVGYETGGNQEFVHQRDNSRNAYNLKVDGARKDVNFFLDQYDRASHFRDEDKYLSAAREAANIRSFEQSG